MPHADKKPYMKHYSPEEIHAMCLQVVALLSEGKREEAGILLKEIPLLPKSAKIMKELSGGEHLATSGYNLAEAMAAFGPDWLER